MGWAHHCGAPTPPRSPQIRGGDLSRELRWGLLFISPAAVYFLVFWILPLVLAVFYSFTDWSIGGAPTS